MQRIKMVSGWVQSGLRDYQDPYPTTATVLLVSKLYVKQSGIIFGSGQISAQLGGTRA